MRDSRFMFCQQTLWLIAPFRRYPQQLFRLTALGSACSLLKDRTVGQECLGTVQQNGTPLPCCQADAAGGWQCSNVSTPAPSGWRLTDPGSIELVGDACTQFLLGSAELISAEFPCEIFSPN